METLTQTSPQPKQLSPLKAGLYILGTLLLFFFALDLMISSLQHLGRERVQTILQATTNPFTGLFIGLLITAMIQSSSTTTALVVALVASRSLSLESAIPIIMGANVGTTITSTIVSLGFIGKKKEFKRAVSAGTYHCFFNLLTVIVLFPLEYYYRFLTDLSSSVSNLFFKPNSANPDDGFAFWPSLNPVFDGLIEIVPGPLLVVVSFLLLFGSILLFRRMIAQLLKAKSPEAFSRFVFKSPLKSFGWGLLTTAAIRSSTITTSVVVPLVAKRIATFRMVVPFIMGANVGTTVTAFIAAVLQGAGKSAMSIAIAHFLFNAIGVLLFFPVNVLREVPVKLANGLGKLTLRYPLACFVFILFTFFIVPFSLIYFNQTPARVLTLTYKVEEGGEKKHYRMIVRDNPHQGNGDWSKFSGNEKQSNEEPVSIFPTRLKGNSFFVGQDAFPFTTPGYCIETDGLDGKVKTCLETIEGISDHPLAGDSVYIFKVKQVGRPGYSRVYFDLRDHIIIKREEFGTADSLIRREVLEKIERF